MTHRRVSRPQSGVQVTVWTKDSGLLDVVLSACAAVGVDVVQAERTLVGPVLVGVDRAPELVNQPWLRGREVHLVGWDADELANWSMQLNAYVIMLPSGNRWLSRVLAGDATHASGLVVGVLGGSGGVGTSTTAVGLAQVAARSGRSPALVDLDPTGPGIDLILGAEKAPGWRWSELGHATGEVGDLAPGVINVEGIHVVAMSRDGGEPGIEQADAVVRSLARNHDIVVLDLGRRADTNLVRISDQVLLLSGARVGAVASARRLQDYPLSGLIVVHNPHRCLQAADVADGIRLPLVGDIPFDRRLAIGCEQGLTPLECGGKAWQRSLTRCLDHILALPHARATIV